jgi:ribonuclease VapC
MIVDSSALLAILFREPEAERFVRAIDLAVARRMSAATWLEAAIVVERQGGATAARLFDEFLRGADIAIEPVTAAQARLARQAYRDFGKGNHPAGLNFGDCFAYALALETREKLLCKGDDFARTGIALA